MIGTIKSLQPTYGFIKAEDGSEFFFHDSDLVGGGDIELAVGDHVTFEAVEPTPAKGPRAAGVSLLSTTNSSKPGGMNE